MNASQEIKDIKEQLRVLNSRLCTCRRMASAPVSGGGGGGADHNILSATHLDAAVAAAVWGDLIYADKTPEWNRLAKGADDLYLRMVAGEPAWAAGGGATILADLTDVYFPSGGPDPGDVLTYESGGWTSMPPSGGGAHNILSVTHTDSTAAAVVAGDLIYGDATPKWTRLAAGGAGQVLTIVGGVPAWAAAAGGTHDILSATHTDTTAAAVTRGDVITGQAAAPNTKWKRLAIGASTTYFKGGTEPSWATLNQAAVAGLTTGSTPSFLGVTITAGSFKLPATQIENQTYGVYEATDTLIRTFRPTGSDGYNLFICIGAGNNTMSPGGGSTAYSSRNIFIGPYSGNATTTGYHNVAMGYFAKYMVQNGYFNTAIGGLAEYQNISGYENFAGGYYSLYQSQANQCTAVGAYSSASNQTGNTVTAIGAYAFYTQTAASGGVALGFEAGYYETAANKLFIDNQKRTNEADGRVKALIYGVFNAATASQSVLFNAAVSIRHNLTMIGNIVIPNGGTVGQAAGPLLNFDDTNNYLEITGCKVGIGTTAPLGTLEVNGIINTAAAKVGSAATGDIVVPSGLGLRSAHPTTSINATYSLAKCNGTDMEFGDAAFETAITAATKVKISTGLIIATTAYIGSEKLRVNGDAYFDADVSALTFTDRTPIAKTIAEAYEAVRSVQGEDGKLDHSKLHPFLIAPNNGRNLSALVSAQAQVIQDLEARILILERR